MNCDLPLKRDMLIVTVQLAGTSHQPERNVLNKRKVLRDTTINETRGEYEVRNISRRQVSNDIHSYEIQKTCVPTVLKQRYPKLCTLKCFY